VSELIIDTNAIIVLNPMFASQSTKMESVCSFELRNYGISFG